MTLFIALDVSQKMTAICIVGETGRRPCAANAPPNRSRSSGRFLARLTKGFHVLWRDQEHVVAKRGQFPCQMCELARASMANSAGGRFLKKRASGRGGD